MFFSNVYIYIDTFLYLGTKRNEEFLIIRVKKYHSIIIPLFFFTCSLNGEYHEKDRFYRSHLFELLIDDNRFVFVKKKKSLAEREREKRFFTFVHSYSLRFSPSHKLDRFRVIVQVSHPRLCFNSPPLLALFFTAGHRTINPAFVSAYFIDFPQLSLF